MGMRSKLQKITASVLAAAVSVALVPKILGNDVVSADSGSEPSTLSEPGVVYEVELLKSANCTITKPHDGEMPDMNPVSAEPDKYDVILECWYLCSSPSYPNLNSTDDFKAGKTYAVRVFFKAKTGYAFDENTQFTVNGDYYGKFATVTLFSAGIEVRYLAETDVPYTGWTENGTTWNYYESGVKATGWKQIGGVWYYFSEYGSMRKGWQEIDGVNYYFKDSGAMVTGWQQIDDIWYYFANSGVKLTGWQEINGKWYYLDATGAMMTGWLNRGGVWYYFESSGSMTTGWKEIDGVYYYFKSSGAMAANEYCVGYWLSSNGAWTYKAMAAWYKDSKGWYYQDSNGWYAKNGTWTIDGVDYDFDSRGYCTNP